MKPTQGSSRAKRCTPSRPKISPDENRRVPLVECRWRSRRKARTRRSTWLFRMRQSNPMLDGLTDPGY